MKIKYKKIRYLLGEPVREIQLTNKNIRYAFEQAESMYKLFIQKTPEQVNEDWIYQYTIAECKNILGLMRGTFNGYLHIDGRDIFYDYSIFLEQAKLEKEILLNRF